MIKKITIFLFLTTNLLIFSQDLETLPTNPEPGKCYVRCITADVWQNEDVKIQVSPKHTKIITYPAEYKTIKEKVLIK